MRDDWQLPVFLACTACFLAWYFLTPLPSRHDILRGEILSLWGIPADLISIAAWTGDGSQRLAVLDRLPVLLVASTILLFSWIAGRLLLQWFGVDRLLFRIERLVFSLAVGLNVVSLYTLAVGLAGWLRHPGIYVAPGVLLLIAAFTSWRRRGHSTALRPAGDEAEQLSTARDRNTLTGELRQAEPAAAPDEQPSMQWLDSWGWIVCVPFALVIVWGSMMPPVDFDVREYHLQVPKEWYQQGRIQFTRHNVYGNLPFGAEMHSLLAMAIMPGDRDWWWGALAGKLIIGVFAPLTAMALFAAGCRFCSTMAGVTAAVVYVSIPWIGKVSMSGLVEGVVACYLLLAVYGVLLWQSIRTDDESRTMHSPRTSLLLLAGFVAGGAVSCKYTGLLFVVLPLMVWVLLPRQLGSWIQSLVLRSDRTESISPGEASTTEVAGVPKLRFRAIAVFLLAAGMGCGLWFGKNWVLTGNPTYPLFHSVFGGQQVHRLEQWTIAHATPPSGWRQASEGFSQLLVRSEWTSPLLFPLICLSLLVRPSRRLALSLLAILGYILATWWLLTHRIDRFWVPALPLAALLAGVGIMWVRTRSRRIAVMALVCLGLISNMLYFVTPVMRVDTRFLVALEALRVDESRVQLVHRYLNSQCDENDTVLLVGDAQPFDLEIPAIYNTCFDENVFERTMKGRTREQRIKALADRNISHVYVHWPEIERYRNSYGFTDYVQPAVIQELVEQGVLEPDLGLETFAEAQVFSEEEREKLRNLFGLYRTKKN